MKCFLFGLTGFGNAALLGILKAALFDEIVVVTRKEQGPFPYYECEQLTDICLREHIVCLTDVDINSNGFIKTFCKSNPDLVVVSTFNQKLPLNILELPRFGAVNVHPSLLPKYRGPTPTHWAIINGEGISGISIHRMTQKFDEGVILFQKKISIENLNDGQLRQALALLTEEHIADFIFHLCRGKVSPVISDESAGSYYPKVTSPDGIALLKSGGYRQENLIRGLTPYPGRSLLYKNILSESKGRNNEL